MHQIIFGCVTVEWDIVSNLWNFLYDIKIEQQSTGTVIKWHKLINQLLCLIINPNQREKFRMLQFFSFQECISCCNFAYCNEPVPTNHSTAILYSSIQTTSGSMSHTSYKWNILPFTISMMGHIFTNHRTLSMPGFMLLLPWLLFTCGVLQSHWVFPLGLSVLGHYSKTSLS